jgi:hypothetical protein
MTDGEANATLTIRRQELMAFELEHMTASDLPFM